MVTDATLAAAITAVVKAKVKAVVAAATGVSANGGAVATTPPTAVDATAAVVTDMLDTKFFLVLVF